MDDTLPDDIWKDSFDKLFDSKPLRYGLNNIKNIRVSLNMDSSVENSRYCSKNSSKLSENPKIFQVLGTNGPKSSSRSISTPCEKYVNNLFNCTLSPVKGGIRFDSTAPRSRSPKESLEKPTRISKKKVFFEKSVLNSYKEPTNHLRPTRSSEKKIKRKDSPPRKWRKSLGPRQSTIMYDYLLKGIPPSYQDVNSSKEGLNFIHMTCRRKSVCINSELPVEINHKNQVLRYCQQRQPRQFESYFTPTNMPNCAKIGEGVYGEVFRYSPRLSNTDVVLKIIPIEGGVDINGEPQKTFEHILPEIIISTAMSDLRKNKIHSTLGFVDVYKVSLVKGKYPQHLIKLWEKYDNEKNSENDHPKVFTNQQLFIVLELNYAGQDLATFLFLNAEQTYYVFQQIVLILAVGETAYNFEHRDLHWGNILIEHTDKKYALCKLNNKSASVPMKGVKVTLIDYTLSRITLDECCHYNDLSTDEELFAAKGDYQYDIYRMMKSELKNDWIKFAPKTNVMWMSYVISKLINGVHYKNVTTKQHRLYIKKLKDIQTNILSFNSAVHYAHHIKKLL